jgi:UDP-N-acetylglucosamine 2-epimerase (non-hydrolysing)
MAGRGIRIISVVGTRPEAIKMAPVATALAARPGLDHRILLTGQHEGLAGHFDVAAGLVRQLDYDPRGRTMRGLRESLRALLSDRFRRQRIDLVLVQGDTASAIAGARAARDCGIPVGHVEAGLRSFDLRRPFPEEGHRIAIDRVAELLFAPTEEAARNLREEARVRGIVLVTGNTGIDALLRTRERLEPRRPAVDPRRLVLVTCHRRENHGPPVRAVCDAVKRIVAELPLRVVVALHPNRHVRRAVEEALAGTAHVELAEPLGYEEMVRLMDESWLILSDSGGLQEEAPALGTPLLVLRDVTERPEAVASGNIALVGTDTACIVAAVARLLASPEDHAQMARPALPFGDGRASERIADAVEAWASSPRPSSAGRAAAPALQAPRPGAR